MKKALILVLIFLVLVGSYFFFQNKDEKYSVSGNAIISYENIQQVKYAKLARMYDGENFTTDKIYFESRGEKIFALLSMPKKGPPKKPAFIIIPGATVPKEGGDGGLGKDLRDFGFATFSLDTRGTGETTAPVNSFEQDFALFSKGEEPVQHKLIYDVLQAHNFLKTVPEIDPEKIYVAGERMGGRLVIIAAAIEPQIKGVLGISTAGYNFPIQENEKANMFLKSFDPDTYIGLVSPKPLIMVHGDNDTTIQIEYAKNTFSKAGNPKKFFEVKGKHGYNTWESKETLRKELAGWI